MVEPFFRVDVFKDFARSRDEFVASCKRSKKIREYLKSTGRDPRRIDEAAIEVDKGRLGNWNDYVRDYGRVKPKKGEKWYEYRLITETVPLLPGGR